MKNWKKRIFSPRTVIGVIAIIALAFTVIACSDKDEAEDDPYDSIPAAPKGVIYTISGKSYSQNNLSYIISWTGVPGALQYYVYVYYEKDTLVGVVTEDSYGDNAYSYTYTYPPYYYGHSFNSISVSAVNKHGESGLSEAVYKGRVFLPCTITFNYNDGYGGMSQKQAYLGESIVLPSGPVRYGYTFTGWRETYSSNSHGNTYTMGQSYEVTDDVTFDAQWTQNTP